MIGKKTPYNAGEIRCIGAQQVLICGHIWWPVEGVNAYHLVYLQNGEPQGEPQYVWDHTHGQWPLA